MIWGYSLKTGKLDKKIPVRLLLCLNIKSLFSEVPNGFYTYGGLRVGMIMPARLDLWFRVGTKSRAHPTLSGYNITKEPDLKPGMMNKFDLEVDTTGLMCPLPLLRLKKAIMEIDSGNVIKVITTDPAVHLDFGVYLHQAGHQLLKLDKHAEKQVFFIQKK